MSPQLWIVIVNYNGWPDVQKCLRSIAQAAEPICNTILVDNASTEDPTASVRAEFPWCGVVRNRTNLGWAGGNNTGIRYALARGADYVLLLNSDTTISPLLPKRMLEAAAAHPAFGILGPVINAMDEPETVMTDGCMFRRSAGGFFQRRPVSLTPSTPPAVTEVDIVNGCCLMSAARVFHRVGHIDERFFLVHEESDFCLRAIRAGFRCGIVAETLVWHKGSQTFQKEGKRWQRYYDARNLFLLLKKNQPRHHGRELGQSAWEYLKYVYYRYSHELENGRDDHAAGVVEGLYDALAGRYGAYRAGGRPGLSLIRQVLEWQRRRRLRTGYETIVR